MISCISLLSGLTLLASPVTGSTTRLVENNVRVLSVSPTPPDSGTVVTWISFSGIANDRAVIFFSLHPSQDGPPPVYDDICDVEYHIGIVDGAVGGRFAHADNVNIVDKFSCHAGR